MHAALAGSLLLQRQAGLEGRVAAYHGDLSIQERRAVHAAFLHDNLTVGAVGSWAACLPARAAASSWALALAKAVIALPNVRLRGVMSIPESTPDFVAALASLTAVGAVFDQLNAEGLGLDTLSIGMSADLEAAIHAGSTMVRVGSAIFGGRSYPA